jgi:glucan phosphoethanolaminetransferase (alkaline phosphatase superfamily)
MNKKTINRFISALVILSVLAIIVIIWFVISGNTFFWLQIEVIPVATITLLVFVFWLVNKRKPLTESSIMSKNAMKPITDEANELHNSNNQINNDGK